MTDTPDTTTEAPPEVEAGTPDTDTDTETTDNAEVDDTDQPKDNNSHEAAKLRKRAQAAERERDQLTEALDVYRTRDAVTLAEQHGLADGNDLFGAETTLADVLGDDGTVDAEKVKAAAEEILEAKPHWRKSKPNFGAGDLGTDVPREPRNSWRDAFKPPPR